MDSQIDCLRAAVLVADVASFSAAAGRLGLTPSAVSKLVSRLEVRLGTRLFQRTTRRVRATEQGRRYLERARKVLGELDELEREVERTSNEPRGTLRITAAPMFGEQRVVPAAFRLLKKWPKLRVTLDLSDRVVDVVAEGIDVAVRYARAPTPTSWTAHKLAEERVVLCATPAYFAKHGVPRTSGELAAHDNVIMATGGRKYLSLTMFERPGSKRLVTIQRQGRAELDGTRSVLAAALAGLGIAELETYLVEEHLRTGRLQECMPGSLPVRSNIYVMHAPGPNVPPKVKAFVAELRGG